MRQEEHLVKTDSQLQKSTVVQTGTSKPLSKKRLLSISIADLILVYAIYF